MPRFCIKGSTPKRKTATVQSRIGYSSARRLVKSLRMKGIRRSIQAKKRSALTPHSGGARDIVAKVAVGIQGRKPVATPIH